MERTPTVLPRLKVLVAEDDPIQQALLKTFLEHLGQEVVCAADGDEAIHLFTTQQPDLVLMDILMPGIDGFEATARIRDLAGSTWVPVIYLTALQQRASLLAGLAAGGHDYLMKPIDMEVLELKLHAMLGAIQVHNRMMAAEALLSLVFDPCQNAAVGFTENGTILACNEGAGRILERDCHSLRGEKVASLFDGEDVPQSREDWLKRAHGEPIPVALRGRDGQPIPLTVRIFSRPFKSHHAFLALFEQSVSN
ncbi:MAG: response regulator [Rhodocyclaceae bacterium]|nr:response regulator [Rhodocyclaceae bacterium]